MAKEEKKAAGTSVFDLAAKFRKEFKDNNMAIKASIVPKYKKVATGAFGFDFPLYGGFPEGRIIGISGPEHSGKTTLAFLIISAYQHAHPEKKCVFIDVEHAADLEHQAKMNNVDLENLLFIDPPAELSGETIMDMIIELQQADDIGVIAIDSIPALLPKVVLESSLEEDKGMRATLAKKYYPFLSIMSGLVREKKNNLVLINQIREVAGAMPGTIKYVEPGGKAPAYFATLRLRCGTRTFTLGENMDACKKEDGLDADGFRLKFKQVKNKVDPANRAGGFVTYRYETGIDTLTDLFEIGLKFGFIPQSGAYVTLVDPATGELLYFDDVIDPKTGKPAIAKDYKKELIAYLRSHDDFREKYMTMLINHISGNKQISGKLLDDADLEAINKQEAAINKSWDESEGELPKEVTTSDNKKVLLCEAVD